MRLSDALYVLACLALAIPLVDPVDPDPLEVVWILGVLAGTALCLWRARSQTNRQLAEVHRDLSAEIRDHARTLQAKELVEAQLAKQEPQPDQDALEEHAEALRLAQSYACHLREMRDLSAALDEANKRLEALDQLEAMGVGACATCHGAVFVSAQAKVCTCSLGLQSAQNPNHPNTAWLTGGRSLLPLDRPGPPPDPETF